MMKKVLAASVFAGLFTCQSVLADDWKYAMEESLTEVQGVYATKFKEYIEANSDHTVQLYPYGTLEPKITKPNLQANLI